LGKDATALVAIIDVQTENWDYKMKFKLKHKSIIEENKK
jgi:hypothetical protein